MLIIHFFTYSVVEVPNPDPPQTRAKDAPSILWTPCETTDPHAVAMSMLQIPNANQLLLPPITRVRCVALLTLENAVVLRLKPVCVAMLFCVGNV